MDKATKTVLFSIKELIYSSLYSLKNMIRLEVYIYCALEDC